MRLFNRTLLLIALAAPPLMAAAAAPAGDAPVRIASGGPQPPRADAKGAEQQAADKDDDAEPTLDQKFARRFPQPVEVAHLIGLPVLDFDEEAAKHYGQMRAAIEAMGRPVGMHDLQIGAHARSLGLTVVTNNMREFERMPDLKLENWV